MLWGYPTSLGTKFKFFQLRNLPAAATLRASGIDAHVIAKAPKAASAASTPAPERSFNAR